MIAKFLAEIIIQIDNLQGPLLKENRKLRAELKQMTASNKSNYHMMHYFAGTTDQENKSRMKLLRKYQSLRTKWQTHYPVFQSIRDRANNAGIPTVRPKRARVEAGSDTQESS